VHVETYEAEGLEVPVETWGSTGETLVFLPGLGAPPREYRPGLEEISARYRVIVPDLSYRRRRPLPRSIDEYLKIVSAVCDPLAGGAPWAGHSFGGLLALLRPAPAIACAPSVPADIPLPATVWRAAKMQVREYLGLEGRAARTYAARILADYLLTTATRPRSLFPVTRSLRTDPRVWPVRSPRSIVFLCDKDDLYRDSEYDDYFVGDVPGLELRRVREGHDWPITHPRLLADRMHEAMTAFRETSGQNLGN